jgi:CheY-like chemotaxis protein
MLQTEFSILIADDNEMNRWLLAEQLQQWCQDVISTSDGNEAWRFLQHQQYSLIFLDVNMPGLTGLELVRKIRADSVNQSTPVIAVTAHVQNQHRHLLIDSGFNDCLIKPLTLADLQQVILLWCETSPSLNSQFYLSAVLERTGQNVELAIVFLEKLFKEAPTLFVELASALAKKHFQLAFDKAHKLHGSFCFYGFNDFRLLAESLETSLLEENLPEAQQHFELLSSKFAELAQMQTGMVMQLQQ